jgi:hypothetical protein
MHNKKKIYKSLTNKYIYFYSSWIVNFELQAQFTYIHTYNSNKIFSRVHLHLVIIQTSNKNRETVSAILLYSQNV